MRDNRAKYGQITGPQWLEILISRGDAKSLSFLYQSQWIEVSASLSVDDPDEAEYFEGEIGDNTGPCIRIDCWQRIHQVTLLGIKIPSAKTMD